jgi:cytochrome c-type biogenesis protein CcmH/NrfG
MPYLRNPKNFIVVSFLFIILISFFIYFQIGSPNIKINKIYSSKEEIIKNNILKNDILNKNKKELKKLVLQFEKTPKDTGLLLEIASTASRTDNIELEISSLEKLILITDTPKIKSLLAQAIVRRANGQVTSKAIQLINSALDENPADPGANFLSGLAASQIGNEKKAYEIWVNLYKNTKINDPWKKDLEINIKTAARNIGINDDILKNELSNITPSSKKNDDTVISEITNLNKKDQDIRIYEMVEQLANRLTKVKSDLSGWIKLYRSYKVLNNQEKAINAIRTATKISPDKIDLKIILLKELMPSDAKPKITNEIEILIQDILTLESKNIEALFFKGLIFLKKGNNKRAINTWEFLIKNLPKDSIIKKEIIKKIIDLKKEN